MTDGGAFTNGTREWDFYCRFRARAREWASSCTSFVVAYVHPGYLAVYLMQWFISFDDFYRSFLDAVPARSST